jgi:hypothetical protein
MNKELECALSTISRLAWIAISNRPGDESERRGFYMNMLKGIKATAGMAIRSVACKKTGKPKSGKHTAARRKG